MIKYIFICLLFVSCNNVQKNKNTKAVESINYKSIPKDTLISYNLEGISTEGAGAEVSYVNGKASKSITYLFSGTGQTILTYYFESDKIKVLEVHYYYKTEMENVKSNEDMQLDKKLNYYIDFKGNVIGESVQDRVDIFQEFKKVVPFKLN